MHRHVLSKPSRSTLELAAAKRAEGPLSGSQRAAALCGRCKWVPFACFHLPHVSLTLYDHARSSNSSLHPRPGEPLPSTGSETANDPPSALSR